ncbi:cytochrome c [Paraglaciecola aquimarina]|uniref:Cytochrome c n=1 Tax=Paraglaciecola aquimarina TaxID=1235557 RepID=A0ABU3STV1_9ALTE|nr:cytochrome c [Paraglaciecola aquimarina]MDU0353407.1 cytochrome c [Paraglaciecola aquimarina]
MTKIKKFIFHSMLCIAWIPISVVLANSVDQEVDIMLTQDADISAGKSLFLSVCAACHNKDLSGATGFNLKDGEWIHGSKPSDIINNINNGFAKAGMPGFKETFSQQQIKQVTAYILSKREGWDNLTYKIYQLDSNLDKLHTSILDDLQPIKVGKAAKNMADFTLPEIKDYALVFEGDFYQPYPQPSKIETSFPPTIFVETELDGEVESNFRGKLNLKHGKQRLKITLMTTDKLLRDKDRGKGKANLSLLVTSKGKRKLFGASTRGVVAMNGNQLNVKVDEQPIIQRKRILDLPPFSIAVGLKEKMNYAFNAKDCSISGVWSGDLLNIGPNVKNRGSDNSLILGSWLFYAPEAITPMVSRCRYVKYNKQGNPSFYFTADGVDYKLEGTAVGSQTLQLKYTVLANPPKNKTLTLSVPPADKININASSGKITGSKLIIDLSRSPQFTLDINAVGAE